MSVKVLWPKGCAQTRLGGCPSRPGSNFLILSSQRVLVGLLLLLMLNYKEKNRWKYTSTNFFHLKSKIYSQMEKGCMCFENNTTSTLFYSVMSSREAKKHDFFKIPSKVRARVRKTNLAASIFSLGQKYTLRILHSGY